MFDDYLNSKEGLLHQYFSRNKNQFWFTINMEPKTKKAIKRSEIKSFRSQVVKHLRKEKRRRFRSKIILEISFLVTTRNPPSIQNLVKNYLDLLHKPMPNVDNFEQILFKDDDQIQLLFAHFETAKEGNKSDKPEIRIKAYRYSSFIRDLDVARVFYRENYDYYEEQREDSLRGDPYNDLEEFEEYKDTYQGELQMQIYDLQKNNIIRDIQAQILKRSILSINNILLLFDSLYDKSFPFQDLGLDKNLIWMTTNHFEMGGGPILRNSKIEFKKTLHSKIKAIKNRLKILFPLLQPISVIVIYTPSAYNALDLDNLAKYILPKTIELLDPPYSYKEGFSRGDIHEKFIRNSNSENLNLTSPGLKSYQIIRLERTSDTPEEGKIQFILNDGFEGYYTNIWRRIEQVILK
ncbi:MAG: hypothetical protein GQ574_09110 [Crocinitomix sp.]|nr:hypothetical protein [Crocinitomix sp.]